MSNPLSALKSQRANLLQSLLQLGDFRAGSTTGTGGRCGNPRCHCHREGDPGHAPHPRLTYKSKGKTFTESFLNPAAQRKAEREIAEFRRFQQLSRDFVAVNEQICRLRPVETTLTPEEEKRPKRSTRRSTGK
jgi:hypothetical protein